MQSVAQDGVPDLSTVWPKVGEIVEEAAVTSVEVESNGRWVAYTTGKNDVVVYGVGPLQEVTRFSPGDRARHIGFSPDGSLLAVGLRGEVRVIDTEDWSVAESFGVGGERSVRGLDWSRDGAWLLYGSGRIGARGLRIELRNTQDWGVEWSDDQGVDVFGVGFVPDSSGFVVAKSLTAGEQLLQFREVVGREVVDTIEVNGSRPTGLGFSPNSQWFVAALGQTGRWGGVNAVQLFERVGESWVLLDEFPVPSGPKSPSWFRDSSRFGYTVGNRVVVRKRMNGAWEREGEFSTGSVGFNITGFRFGEARGLAVWSEDIAEGMSRINVHATRKGGGTPITIIIPGIGEVSVETLAFGLGVLGLIGIGGIIATSNQET